ncbi:nuclear transcription factor Y subunit beta-like isoform X2 [Patiria miniata]|uniref:RING-type domain-containing protein n=1 Tax=Patiria miniata TaxID=46514 RepID=A0A913Z2V4_PATMI|nr:nuclear transcription factor Y subunit beta-like isoform X2 [Patiria miniata]
MSNENSTRSDSSNSSDSEESCVLSALKLDGETPACKVADSKTQADGAAGGVSPGGSPSGNTANSLGLAEGLDKLLQKQRSDLLFELRKLQHGQRPVTNTDRRETLEEFFSDALGQSSTPGQPEGGVPARRQASRPESVVSEVQGLSERRPVSSVLGSESFRRNLEDVIRGTLVRQDRELQQAIRLRAAGFDVGNSRAPSTGSNADTLQQHMENLSQLSHSSSSSHPSGLGDMSVFPPPPPPPVQPMMPQQPQLQFQQQPGMQWRPQQPQWQPNMYHQQPWQQQQYAQWQQQQQQQQQWQQQQQQWQPPVQPQQPWLMQNSPAPRPNNNGGINMVALLQHVQREETVFEISDLVQRQVVSSMLNSNFRGTLENTMMGRLQQTEADGLSVQNFVQSLQQSHRHQRNDFSHLGIHAPARQQSAPVSAGGPATWAGSELDTMRRQMEEMQTMMRLTFELQLDMQRSIRQEVAAALNGQHRPDSNSQAVAAPIPPSQPASEGQCVICLEKSVDAVLYQCGHMCCCLSCGLRLKGMGSHCPMCRAPIRDVIRAYRCQRD